MNEAPFLSVIIPSYNSALTIGETLKSIRLQAFTDLEVLIMDGASTDNTLQIVQEIATGDSAIQLFVDKDNGVYDAMNKGIARSRGTYLYFMGANDVFVNETVLNRIFHGGGNEADMIYGNVLLQKENVVYDGPFDLEKLVKHKNISHQAIFYKKSLFERLGDFDTAFKICADHDFNIRCFRSDAVIRYMDVVVAIFNQEGLSSTKEDLPFQRKRTLLAIELFEDPVDVYRKYKDYDKMLAQLMHSSSYRLGRTLLKPVHFLKGLFS